PERIRRPATPCSSRRRSSSRRPRSTGRSASCATRSRPSWAGSERGVRLITAHRILIGAAIAFFLFYSAFQVRHYFMGDGAAALVQAAVAAAVAGGLTAYYRTLNRWGKR